MQRDPVDTHLVLLPPAPWPVTQDAISAAYRTPLTSILDELSVQIHQTGKGLALDVALLMPWLARNPKVSQAALYSVTQTAVAGVYKLICIIAAKHKR